VIFNLLLILAVIGLVLWLITSYVPMPAPAKQVVIVVGVILMLVVSLRALGIWF
jgi:hypothetical protein